MAQFDTNPASADMATTETITWGADASALIVANAGWSVNTPTTVLQDITNAYSTVVLSYPPTSSGNVISQTVVGSALTRSHTYALLFSFAPILGALQVVTMRMFIRVPE